MRTISPSRAPCKASTTLSNPSSSLSQTSSPPALILARTAAAGLIISSMGFSSLYAWQTASGHGLLLGALTVLFAVALECAKPLAVHGAFQAAGQLALGRTVALGALATVAIAYSLTAELSLLATAKGDAAAGRAALADVAEARKHERARLEADLAALGTVRPAGEVKAELDGIVTAHRLGSCGPRLPAARRAICAEQVAPLRAELARAERRAELSAKLSGQQRTVAGRVVGSADAGAAALGTYLAALGLQVPTGVLSQWLVLVPVLAIELGSALALVLVSALAATPTRGDNQPPAASKRPQRPKSGPEGAILKLLGKEGGKLANASCRGLSIRVGYSKTAVSAALASLEAGGLIRRTNGWLVSI